MGLISEYDRWVSAQELKNIVSRVQNLLKSIEDQVVQAKNLKNVLPTADWPEIDNLVLGLKALLVDLAGRI